MLKGRMALVIYAAVWLVPSAIPCSVPADEPDVKIEQLRPKNVGKLELSLKTSLAAIRSDAPFSIDLELNSTYPDVIDGDLELTFVDDGEVRLRLQTDPLAVPNGQKSFRVFVPTLWARQERANFVVRAVFHGPRAPLDLGTHDLVVPLKGQRVFLMAAAGLGDATINQFTRHLGLDMFRPTDAERAVLLTLPVELDLKAIPADPMGLYPFDLLVLAGEHFSRLSARQLDTIAEWVETGGGVVVVPTGVVTPPHIKFLERLAGHDAKSAPFVADEFGRLATQKPGSKDWLLACHYGFGRALILRDMPVEKPDGSLTGVDAAAWTRAVCFLWNVRPEQTAEILKSGSWKALTPPSNDEFGIDANGQAPQRPASKTSLPKMGPASRATMKHSNYSEYDERAPLHPEALAQADALRALLFPEEVRVVPFRVVATILGAFLFVIAPADYFILGLLRRRKYTWFLFPVSCIVFTVTAVVVARHFTGTTDHRGVLAIVDFGENGKPLRTTRIEHIITAGTRRISTSVKNGLFARTDVQPQNSRHIAVAKGAVGAYDEDVPKPNDNEPLDLTGLVPLSYSATRLSRQWSPSMERVTTSGTSEALPPIPWSELEAFDPATKRGRNAIMERLRGVLPECEVLFLTSSGQDSVQSVIPTTGSGSRFHNWPTVLAGLGQRSGTRLFSIISRISPNGAGDLEDLSVLDPLDANACLLHVATRRGDDLLVFRRFLRSKGRFDLN